MKPVTWRRKLTQLFGMDYRSLALMRVFLGLTTLYDLALRSRDLRDHYTDDGVLPRHTVLAELYQPYWISLYMLNGSFVFIVAMFGLHALCVALWTVGYRTRLMTVACCVLQNSLNNRNILVTHGGDIYARCILFFGAFLPLGTVFSVDSVLHHPRRRRRRQAEWTVLNGGSVALMLQIGCMYYSSYLHKSGVEWYPNGDATYLALRNDQLSYGLSHVLLLLPFSALRVLTLGVLFWEGVGPLLFCSPWATDACRMIAVIGFVGMHAGFESCLRLDSFGPVCMSAVLSLLPTSFWDRLALWLRRRSKRAVRVRVGAQCAGCHTAHRLLQAFLLVPDHELEPLQSLPLADAAGPKACGSHRPDGEPLWLVDGGHQPPLADVAAVSLLLEASPLFWPLAPLAAWLGRRPAFGRLFREFVHNHDFEPNWNDDADGQTQNRAINVVIGADEQANARTSVAVVVPDGGVASRLGAQALCWQAFGLVCAVMCTGNGCFIFHF
eukprot:TRINITY_DN10169_c0_g1_i2.p1 TRINITY_DN10169_c0_g1~~TRINITY_DN10169_c0_g1_i2.p1  ORF type:complete len:496 (-),score=144.32 TRINITY_DN10169_c0_g1_i2:93-1580(-)